MNINDVIKEYGTLENYVSKMETLNKKRKKRSDSEKPRTKYSSTLPPLYRSYIMRSNKKGIPFSLTVEEFTTISNSNCIYCNQEGGTIDRIDSKQGYTISNSTPCCKQCNMMKYTYSQKSFLDKVKDIYNHTNSVN